ncbi:hypothetical protein [Aeromonas phage AerS_266]|nr:hypothetical protein [Aeromonas phage AerS_266]
MDVKEILVLKNHVYIGSFLCKSSTVELITIKLNDYQKQIRDFTHYVVYPDIKKMICSNDKSNLFLYMSPSENLDVPGFAMEHEFKNSYSCLSMIQLDGWINMLSEENVSTWNQRTEEFGIKYHDGNPNQNLVYPTNCEKLNKYLELTDKMKQAELVLTPEQENKLLHGIVNELLEENKRLSSMAENSQYDLKA